MYLTSDQIDELRFEALRKKIKNKDIAKYINCSEGLVSLYLNHKTNMSEHKQRKLIEYIKNQPEVKYIRVELK